VDSWRNWITHHSSALLGSHSPQTSKARTPLAPYGVAWCRNGSQPWLGFPVGKPNWARASGQYLHVGKLWRAPRKSPSRRPRRPIPRLFRVLYYRLRTNLPEPELPLVPLLSNINCIRYQWQTLYVYLTLLGYGLTLTYRIRALG